MSKLPIFISFFLLSSLFFSSFADPSYNVQSYGAKADGKTDSSKAFLKAWAQACSRAETKLVTMYVPRGKYLLKAVEFRGPCKSRIEVKIDGTIVAPSNYWELGNTGNWILFDNVDRLRVIGGTLDGRGSGYWSCRKYGKSCPPGARSLAFNSAKNVVVSDLTSVNSQYMHISIDECDNILIRNVKLTAPAMSPNTDGIHMQKSNGVTITGSTIKTGDDCISIGPGTKNLVMDSIQCGPGHGISIGSLAQDYNEQGVERVTLSNSVFLKTSNGIRIKSWARPSKAYVKNITISNIIMRNVINPIIIDQNYCPNNQGCPRQASGVKISQVTYKNIRGTSASQVAVLFDCSPTNPCQGIGLQDIKLTYLNKATQASCKHIVGTTSGVNVPRSCL